MKNLALLTCVIMLCVGCAGAGSMSPAAAFPGTILTDVTFPGANFNQTQYTFAKSDFEIVGPVTAEAESTSILGILASGDSGYGKLYANAKAQGADDVICVKVDTYYYNILALFSRVKTKLHGVGIRWKK